MSSLPPAEAQSAPYTGREPNRFQRFLYWLAGARWDVLRECPPPEHERVAILGSTVLVPTTMAFLGMFFFVQSRFAEPPFFPVLAVSLLWAFVIMTTDRVLISMYRPFQPLWRRFIQVIFRLGMAVVISLAISFPFCLDQYRPAIRFRYQTELQGTLNGLRNAEAAGRKELRLALANLHESHDSERRKLEAEQTTRRQSLTAQLPALERGQINPELYADERMEEERRRVTAPDFVAPASGSTLNVIARMDAQKDTLQRLTSQLEEQQSMHRRMVEAIAREQLGLPNEFYPEAKKPGEGPRLKDMKQRDAQVETEIRKIDAAIKAATSEIAASEEALARARLSDRNNYLDSLNGKRPAYVAEAEEKERARRQKLALLNEQIARTAADDVQALAKLEARYAALEEDQARAQQRHNDTYLPPITRLESKINGLFDPMEETIGLYKVIFLPPPDMPQEQGMKHRWMAGLFQFLVVFSTLFLLDLIPIIVKLLSRPGAYDILVEHFEFTANANWRDFRRHYKEHGSGWPGETPGALGRAETLMKAHYRAPEKKAASSVTQDSSQDAKKDA